MFRSHSFRILVLSIVIFTTACTKIDTTRLGSDLIPPVDNVNTFDTLLDVTTRYQPFLDSTRLARTELHAIGNITNDPLFGNLNGAMYFEMLPTLFPSQLYTKDSLVGLDSIVLCLRYEGNYGDSAGLQPVQFTVYKLNEQMHADTLSSFPAIYNLSKTFTTGGQLATKFYPALKNIGDSVSVRRDSTRFKVKNQVRISLPITDVNLRSLFFDTTAVNKSDTALRLLFKGFKVEANVTPGAGLRGALTYFNLSDTATRLEFYYRRRIGGAKIDTTSAAFFCGSNAGHANNIVRNTAGSEFATNINSDSLLYITTNPGSYGRIKIPGLPFVTNRIVHRAELRLIQIPDDLSTPEKLRPPSFLYLDRFDTAIDRIKFNPIPFDLNPSLSYSCFPADAGVDYSYFGGVSPETVTIAGKRSYLYRFNLTRYVQGIITRHEANPELRLSSALFAEYFNCTGVSYVNITGNRIAEGRVKLGGGGAGNSTSPYKMQLRIIYSKL